MPNTYPIIPNAEIAQPGGPPFEYDLIVITPHAVYVVEVKRWLGGIQGDDFTLAAFLMDASALEGKAGDLRPQRAHLENVVQQAARLLHGQGLRLWALEGEPLFAARPAPGGGPLVLVVGNELAGIDPEILALCERVLAIPMPGAKHSLDAAVAFGIAAYHLRFGVAGPSDKWRSAW